MSAALIATLFFALSVICGHRSSKILGGTSANFWRLAIAAVMLTLWVYGTKKSPSNPAFFIFFLSGMIGIGLGDLSMFQALPWLGPRLTSLIIQCLTAPFGCFVEWLWLRTPLTLLQLVFVALVILGVFIALNPHEHKHLRPRTIFLGISCCLLAALATALGAVLSRKGYAVLHAHGTRIEGSVAAMIRVCGGLLVGGLGLLGVKQHRYFFANPDPLPPRDAPIAQSKWKRAWLWVFLNGLAGQTLGMSFMQRALETAPAGLVLPIIAATPIAVIPLEYLFEGRKPARDSVLGAFVAVGGVIGLVLSKHQS